MSAGTLSVAVASPANPVTRSIRDWLVVAQRNLIRMTRIPDRVRSCRSGPVSPRIRDQRSNTWKEQVK